MTNAEHIGKRIVRCIDALVNGAVAIMLLLLFLLGAYMLWDSHLVYQAADAANYTIYRPTVEDSLSFGQLRQLNSDVISWLTIYGTHVDYPVVQGEDNTKYLNTDAEGNYSLAGALFLDCDASPDFSDRAHVIYGHHMDQDAMFGEIGSFQEKRFFDAHEYGSLYANGKMYGVQFFAFLAVDAYATDLYIIPQTEQASENYLQEIFAEAVQLRDTDVSAADRLVVLSTCTADSTNGRHLLIGRLTEKPEADPYAQAPEEVKTGSGIDNGSLTELRVWLKNVPVWLLIIVPIVILIIVWLAVHCIKRKTAGRRKHE